MGQTSSAFSYALEARESGYSGIGELWRAAKSSSTGKSYAPVSVFQMQVASKEDSERAEKYAANMKRLRNPAILRYLDCVVQEKKMLLVTELVVPLESVKDTLTYSQLIFSMERVLHALNFMHVKAKLSHNNICLAVVFVHRSPENVVNFKLGGFAYCSDRPSSGGALSTHPQPPESPRDGSASGTNSNQKLPVHCRDIWQLGYMLPQLLDMNNGVEAVTEMSLRMRNQDPFQRPTAADLLRHPFFARDPFLEIMLFLQSFRVHSQDAKKEFFSDLDGRLGGISSRDLRESVIPLLSQTDVFIEPMAQHFWKVLFTDYSTHYRDNKELDSGVLVSDLSDHLIPNLLQLLASPMRARKAAILRQLPWILSVMEPDMVLSSVYPPVLECLKDSDSSLCIMALDACIMLTAYWIERKDEAGLNILNQKILIEMRSLALDADVTVRQKVVSVLAILIIMYDKINGMLGIRVIISALGDPSVEVVLAALKSIDKMKALMTSVVIVHTVLPGLVALLLSKNDEIRMQSLELIMYLSNLVAKAKDRTQWPDVSIKNIAALIGTTQRRDLFQGSLVEIRVRAAGTADDASSENGSDEDPDDEAWDEAWSKKDAEPGLFRGLAVKEKQEAVVKESAKRLAIEKVEIPAADTDSEDDYVQPPLPLERQTYVAPKSPRSHLGGNVLTRSMSGSMAAIGKTAESQALNKDSAELPADGKAVAAEKGQLARQGIVEEEKKDIEDLLAAKKSESEEEEVVFGTVQISDDEFDDDNDNDLDADESAGPSNQNMLDAVLQSQAIRKDIIANKLPANDKPNVVPATVPSATPAVVSPDRSKFDLMEADEGEAVADNAWGSEGWGDDDIELPEDESA